VKSGLLLFLNRSLRKSLT